MWIRSEISLGRNPKTKRLARELDVNIPTAIGHLHLLWYFVLEIRPEGCLVGIEYSDLADAAGWEGEPVAFVKALEAAGWIDDVRGDCMVHDWHDYAGNILSNRKRQKKFREKQRANVTVTLPKRYRNASGNAPVTHDGRTDETDETRESLSPPPLPASLQHQKQQLPLEASGSDHGDCSTPPPDRSQNPEASSIGKPVEPGVAATKAPGAHVRPPGDGSLAVPGGEAHDDHHSAVLASAEAHNHLSRYDNEQRATIVHALDAVASTRETGLMADSVRAGILRKLARHPVAAVVGGCKTYLERGYADEGKRENYLLGIVRGLAKEKEQKAKRAPTQTMAHRPAAQDAVRIDGIRYSKGEILSRARAGDDHTLVEQVMAKRPEWFKDA